MSDLELVTTEKIQTFELVFKGIGLSGEITNRSGIAGERFVFQADEFRTQYSASQLRAIADRLDALNSEQPEEQGDE